MDNTVEVLQIKGQKIEALVERRKLQIVNLEHSILQQQAKVEKRKMELARAESRFSRMKKLIAREVKKAQPRPPSRFKTILTLKKLRTDG